MMERLRSGHIDIIGIYRLYANTHRYATQKVKKKTKICYLYVINMNSNMFVIIKGFYCYSYVYDFIHK